MSATGKKSEHRSASGFTLIEVLIALVVLATGIVVIMRAFETSAVALGEARDHVWATLLVSEKLADVDAFISENPGALPPSDSGQFSGPYRDFQWRMETSDAKGFPGLSGPACDDGDLGQVVVTIWRSGTRRQYKGVTLVRPSPPDEKDSGGAGGR